MDHFNEEYYIQVLEAEFRKRKNENPAYSLRSFASALNIDVSDFTKVFKRRRDISMKAAFGIVQTLSMDAETQTSFLLSVAISNWLRYMKRHGFEVKGRSWIDALYETHVTHK